MKTRRNFRNKSAKSRCRKHRYTKRGGGPSLNTYTINTKDAPGAPGAPFVPLAPGAPGPGAWWRPPDWKPIPTPKPKTPKPKKKPGTAFRIPGTTGNTFKFKTPARKDADALIEKKDRIRKLQKFITEYSKKVYEINHPSQKIRESINALTYEEGQVMITKNTAAIKKLEDYILKSYKELAMLKGLNPDESPWYRGEFADANGEIRINYFQKSYR